MATPRKSSLDADGIVGYFPDRHAPVEIGEVNSIEHTARIFGVSVAQITRLQADGKLAPTGVLRTTVFSRNSIMRFIPENTDAHTVRRAGDPLEPHAEGPEKRGGE